MKFEKEKLQLGEFIAHGTFGAVYRGEYDGQKVAVKALNFFDKLEEQAFIQEAFLWSKLDHPNVAKFIGATQLTLPDRKNKGRGKLHWCMVSEFLEGGALDKYLYERKKKDLPLKTVVQFALDVARGLDYMHSKKVVHRDVKTNNMVLDNVGSVKLIDFGLSRKEASNLSDMTGNTGTVLYMAPEVSGCKPYDHKCDVFSFGICLWEMFYCRRPEISPPMVLGDCPDKLADLMLQCWVGMERRPEMAQVVEILEEMMAEEEAKAEAEAEAKRRKKGFKGCFGFFTRS